MELQRFNYLEAYTESHQARTYKWANSSELSHFMNYPGKISLEDHKNWYERVIKQHIFALVFKDTHIGNCCLKNLDPISMRAELWIYIGDEKFRGKGFGTKALKELLDYGFRNLKLNKIFLYFLDYNVAAEKLYSKCGFKYEGKFRKHYFTNGRFHDAVYMGILKEEWFH